MAGVAARELERERGGALFGGGVRAEGVNFLGSRDADDDVSGTGTGTGGGDGEHAAWSPRATAAASPLRSSLEPT